MICRYVTVASLLLAAIAQAAESDWLEGNQSGTDGATRDYYNRAAGLAWNRFMGDWRDRDGTAHGPAPFSIAEVTDDDTGKFVSWDVTDLVIGWRRRQFPQQGFFLRAVSDSGDIHFYSRQHGQKVWRPQLDVVIGNETHRLDASADTFLTPSTYRSQGLGDHLRVSAAPDHTLLRFDWSKITTDAPIEKATLRLYSDRQYGSATIGVFRCQQSHDAEPSQPIVGVAWEYPGDREIESDPSVLFAADFEDPAWADRWSVAEIKRVIDTVADDDQRKFEPLRGKALRVRIARGANGALNTLWKFAERNEQEPTESYFRYYLRLADDWNQTIQGGKLPGFSGTYGVTGWGGRRSFGDRGWSARGLFQPTIPAGNNPLAGTTPIGTYCYHADMESRYGTNWLWQIGYRGYLENNRWYCIEQHVKLNTPGKNDGILRAWVDGRLAFEKKDIRFRNNDRLKIEQVWMNVYHGGTRPSPHDQHVFIDQVVIADRYIGPMRQEGESVETILRSQ